MRSTHHNTFRLTVDYRAGKKETKRGEYEVKISQHNNKKSIGWNERLRQS